MVRQHAGFHTCAADVVRKVESGNKATARDLLSGAFATASKDTIAAILKLKKEVGA